MPGPDAGRQKEEARRWLGYAERDAVAAKRAIEVPPPLADIAAYHCQQAAEKLLKAVLVASAVRPRKTHDLDFLADEVAALAPPLAALALPLRRCATWAVAYRYPLPDEEPEPEPDEVRTALDQIDQLARAVRQMIDRED